MTMVDDATRSSRILSRPARHQVATATDLFQRVDVGSQKL
jgi:hypothetical protein